MPKTRGNGEGSIYKVQSKNLWACQVTLPNGKRKTLYGKTRKETKEIIEIAKPTCNRS